MRRRTDVNRNLTQFLSAALIATACVASLRAESQPAPDELVAATPTDLLLPNTTKGYLSVPSVEAFKTQAADTQLGRMAVDPLVQDFADDLKRQLRLKLGHTEARIGITLDDLSGLHSGEAAIASIQPKPGDHAMMLLADVTGNERKAAILLFKISKNVVAKGGKSTALRIERQSVTKLDIPRRGGALEGRSVYHAVVGRWLIASDNPDEIAQVIRRMESKGDSHSLANHPAYSTAMSRAKAHVKGQWQVRWFVEPFGYASIAKAINAKRNRRGKADIAQVLERQGFNAIQGIAGYITLADGTHDLVHRTFVYVPVGGAGKTKAARMLDFPNSESLEPQAWVPQDLSSYATFRWKVKEAFEHSKSLVNDLAGEEIFDDVLDSIRDDPVGPKVDIRKDIVANLGERVSLITHYTTPITAQSERLALAVELTDPKAVADAVRRIMIADDNAVAHSIGGVVIWEIKTPEEETKVGPLEIQTPGQFIPQDEPEEELEEASLPQSAVAVAHGHLFISTHIDILEKVITHKGPSLAMSADYLRMDATLNALGAGPQCMRLFNRTDEAYRVNYELLRSGKMPESETMLGGLMNELLGVEGDPRVPAVDGKKMPDFKEVQKYLGASGSFARSEQDGVLFIGCILKKEAPKAEPLNTESPE